MVIDKNTFHLVYYEKKQIRNPIVKPELTSSSPNTYTWDLQTELISSSFTWNKDSIFLKSLEQSYYHYLINNVFKTVDYRVSETFSLYIYDNNAGTSSKNGELRSSLYGRSYKYDEFFWSEYKPVHLHPLETFIIDQLSAESPLQEQFKSAAGARFAK